MTSWTSPADHPLTFGAGDASGERALRSGERIVATADFPEDDTPVACVVIELRLIHSAGAGAGAGAG